MPRQRRGGGGEAADAAADAVAVRSRNLENPRKSTEYAEPSREPSRQKKRKKEEQDYQGNKCLVVFLFASTAIVVTCIKFLLIPSYYSTDFEVHRNWMAITSQLPLSQWYTEVSHSPPPTPRRPPSLYMRLTVIAADLVYLYAAYVWVALLTDPAKHLVHGLGLRAIPSSSAANTEQWTSSPMLYTFLLLVNVGHLLVDHIHFQYNGLLNGLLLLSMARMVDGQIYWSALWFAVLLNLKHIYLYAAPAYGVFLLVEHCLTIDRNSPLRGSRLHWRPLLTLAVIVVGVFAASFGPFIARGQLPAILRRLFPFARGLSHAYWAPNFWALYNGADLLLAKVLRRGSGGRGGITSGLVKVSEHAVLPTISPNTSLTLVMIFILTISFLFVWNRSHASPSSSRIRRRRSVVFIELLLLSTLSFFAFGYQVHEKAILLVLPTMVPLVLANAIYARLFLVLSVAGTYSLFPLLYREAETPIKVLLLLAHVLFLGASYTAHFPRVGPPLRWWHSLPLVSGREAAYLLGFVPLQLATSLGPWLAPALAARLPFLPLAVTSVYCAIGVLYVYGRLLKHFAAV
ncbi:glycosyl transferase [Tyrophagus putrescentiae]|nr:glycosyl transferase [Tyrophagus putrescentiae]